MMWDSTERQVVAALRIMGGIIPVGVLPIAEWGWGSENQEVIKLAG